MSTSAIEWTEVTWNPTVGCDRISPGCAHCYAKELHDRRHKAFLAGKSVAPQYAQPFEVLQLLENRLDAPLRRKKPTVYFVNSVSDLFHEDVPDAFIDRVFAVMALTPQHTYQVLTKRAERMRAYSMRHLRPGGALEELRQAMRDLVGSARMPLRTDWPVPNVWLGVSVENQHFADARIPELLQTTAAVRFISAEPLLERIVLDNGETSWLTCTPANREREHEDCCLTFYESDERHFHGIDWVIVGGESGAGARRFEIQWARSIVTQCRVAGVPVFVKQLGARPFSEWADLGPALQHLHRAQAYEQCQFEMALGDRKGGDPAEWPEDLRVREYPTVPA